MDDFGAIGDGVTDDQPAFAAALAAVPAAGGLVLMGAKTYRLGSKLDITKAGVRLAGEAFVNAISSGGAPKLFCNHNNIGIQVNAAGCTLEKFYLVGNDTVSNGIQVGNNNDSAQFCARDVTVSNCVSNNIHIMDGGGTTNVNYWRLERVFLIDGLGNGLYVEGATPDVNSGYASSVVCFNNGRSGGGASGILINGAVRCFWANCNVENTVAGFGFRILAGQGHLVFGGEYSNNGGSADIVLAAGVVQNVFILPNFSAPRFSDSGTNNNLVNSAITW